MASSKQPDLDTHYRSTAWGSEWLVRDFSRHNKQTKRLLTYNLRFLLSDACGRPNFKVFRVGIARLDFVISRDSHGIFIGFGEQGAI